MDKDSYPSIDGFASATLRLLDGAFARDILFRELMAILQQYFAANQIIIFRKDKTGKLAPLRLRGCSKEQAAIIGESFNIEKAQASWWHGKECIFHQFENEDEQIVIWLRVNGLSQKRASIDSMLKLVELILAFSRRLALQSVITRAVTPKSIELVHESASMREVVSQIEVLSACRSTVLITGEYGTGKELVARAIHQNSVRADRPFITYNCSSIPKEIAESELFGHRKGAFTGAHLDSPGIIRSAEGGTIFLDEIGDLPLEIQPKLLRFLEYGEVQPLGLSKVIKTDVRVIAATNRDLRGMMTDGRFRPDLWYRLNVTTIAIPPLRERREDIPLLVEHLMRRISVREGRLGLRLAPGVIEKLMKYDWPGNVREMVNEIERLVVFTPSHGKITVENLSPVIRDCGNSLNSENGSENGMGMVLPPKGTKLAEAMAAYEQLVICEALQRHNGSKAKTAKELGISREWLRQKLKRRTGNKQE
jgi:transcriptional regulator with GAF, ATPase, and Fis domain